VRVIRTNTPLHALILMNDVTYSEAASALAERALREGGPSPIAWAFETLLARPPSAEESAVLGRRLAALGAYYAAHPEEAADVACAGERAEPPEERRAEIAAMAGVMTVLLNLDETMTRE
jgi:hypothetical protein